MSNLFGVVGDVHGDFDALNRAMSRHGEAVFWLSVGDLASDDLRYPDPVASLYFIQGNNEDFNFIAQLRSTTGRGADAAGVSDNLRFLANGTCSMVHGLGVAALGGTLAPTWYDTAAADLPFPGKAEALPHRHAATRTREGASSARPVRDDKRRHFVREQVEALEGMRGVDVLLTHEAPRPFFVQAGPRRLDAGKTPINEVLHALRPRLHFFGHHHRFADTTRDGVRSIGLDLVSRSYVLVDGKTFHIEKVDTAPH